MGLAQESALKLLELAAGEVVTYFDSPLGIRHGPKSVLAAETLVGGVRLDDSSAALADLMPAVVRDGVLHVDGVAVTPVSAPEGPMPVGVQPEHLRLHTSHADDMVPARVDFIEPLGSRVLVTAFVGHSPVASLAQGETRVVVQAPPDTELESGTRIGLEMTAGQTYFFDAETGATLARYDRERIPLSPKLRHEAEKLTPRKIYRLS